MSRILYIFVDESGNPSDGSYYVVAGSWCISERNNPNEVLRPTIDRLITTAEASLHHEGNLSELKCSKLPTEVINNIASCLNSVEYEDQSIEHTKLPWGISYPIRFSFHSTNSQVGTELLSDLLGNFPQSVFALKTLALGTILNPVFQSGQVDNSQFDKIVIILDADPWKNPGEKMEQMLETIGVLTCPIEINTADSNAIPGLQLADLAAYSWARHERKGDCGSTVKKFHQLRFSDN